MVPNINFNSLNRIISAFHIASPPAPQVTGATYSQAEYDEAYEIGKRDGYSEAVQQIDQLTGGDGEYRYCLGDEGSARHTPGPSEMIQRIIDRFETLNLLDEAAKSGRDQEWGDTAPAPQTLWHDISTAPKDRKHIIIAVPTKDRDSYIVGEAYFDPYEDSGDWWWAGTSYDVYHDEPISEINYHPPRFWQPMPLPPSVTTEGQS